MFEPNREKKKKKKKKREREKKKKKKKKLTTNNTVCFYIFPSPVIAVESLQLYVIPAVSKEPLALRSIAPRPVPYVFSCSERFQTEFKLISMYWKGRKT